MKIGLFSDLHLEHRGTQSGVNLINRAVETARGCDVIINAGDTHHQFVMRDLVRLEVEKLDIPYLEVLGNHDFYGNHFHMHTWYTEINGIKFYGNTMWTDFDGDPDTTVNARRCISDFRYIQDVTTEVMTQAFNQTQFDVLAMKPDVVVTHFAPSRRSVHARFEGDDLNGYFCPNAEKTILLAEPKLWLHGHVHDPHEYTMGKTRVVCNPMGYPRETYENISDYSTRIIEI